MYNYVLQLKYTIISFIIFDNYYLFNEKSSLITGTKYPRDARHSLPSIKHMNEFSYL